MSDHLTEGWPLGPTGVVYMDGTAGYHVRHYDKPGILAVPELTPDQAQAIRDVVAARIAGLLHEAWEEGQKAGVTNQWNWDGWRHDPAAIENPYPKVSES